MVSCAAFSRAVRAMTAFPSTGRLSAQVMAFAAAGLALVLLVAGAAVARGDVQLPGRSNEAAPIQSSPSETLSSPSDSRVWYMVPLTDDSRQFVSEVHAAPTGSNPGNSSTFVPLSDIGLISLADAHSFVARTNESARDLANLLERDGVNAATVVYPPPGDPPSAAITAADVDAGRWRPVFGPLTLEWLLALALLNLVIVFGAMGIERARRMR